MSGIDITNRITANAQQCGGRPCIRGMRIRVTDVLDLLEDSRRLHSVRKPPGWPRRHKSMPTIVQRMLRTRGSLAGLKGHAMRQGGRGNHGDGAEEACVRARGCRCLA